MALRLRKDIKKSSYYVWFLGAKESKGLRGSEFVLPVIGHLIEREKDVEPFKVTLQVSHKGLKIVQNVVTQANKSSKPKNETIKHFIPHNTITCVYQQEDIVACILLLFNPVTKCPLHVHAYRCDSLETAAHLKQQLQVLVERPENQKKFAEIENRLKATKEAKKIDSSIGSDTGTSTRESESSEERFGNDSTRVATLYDSVAAELRAKLNKNDVPILLPPRDYDTVHRQKGNLTGIEMRRCLNTNIVGQNVKAGGRRMESSGGSSGIGSDHPPSPDSPEAPDPRFNAIDNQSTSDEEWNADTSDSTLYLMHATNPPDLSLPRPTSYQTIERPSKQQQTSSLEQKPKWSSQYEDAESKQFDKFLYSTDTSQDRPVPLENDRYVHRRSSKSPNDCYNGDREGDNKCRYNRESNGYKCDRSSKYIEKERYHSVPVREEERVRPRYVHEDDSDYFKEPAPVSRSRHKYPNYESRYYFSDGARSMDRVKTNHAMDEQRFYSAEKKPSKHERYSARGSDRDSTKPSEKFSHSKEDYIEMRKWPEHRQRSPSPIDKISPRDRFKDAKEKFLLLERERMEEQERTRKSVEPAISPVRKERHFVKRQESMHYPNNAKERFDRYERYDGRELKERYFDDNTRYDSKSENIVPKPTPRNAGHHEEVRLRRDVPLDRYNNQNKYDQKRRSMFNLIEEEHRKNSGEIAKELKRRSYMENNNYEDNYYRERDKERDRSFAELPESDRYTHLERDEAYFSKSSAELDRVGEMKFVKNNQKLNKSVAGYRHSYAEPKLKGDKIGSKKPFAEMLHRTNSTVSNSGRVGIASVHPY